MSWSLSLDPGLIGRQTLGYEARPPGFKALLCSLLALGPRANDFPSLAQFVTVSPGHPPQRRDRVSLECYFR